MGDILYTSLSANFRICSVTSGAHTNPASLSARNSVQIASRATQPTTASTWQPLSTSASKNVPRRAHIRSHRLNLLAAAFKNDWSHFPAVDEL